MAPQKRAHCKVPGCPAPRHGRGNYPAYCLAHGRERGRTYHRRYYHNRKASRAVEPAFPVLRVSEYGDRHGSVDRRQELTIMVVDHVSGAFYTGIVTFSVARLINKDRPDTVERQIRCARAAGTLVVERTSTNRQLLETAALPDASDDPAQFAAAGD